ncbi:MULTISPECIES: NAD(P)-dependent alcohol dehydrogenase [unclassified Streptomyces]|uniref:NAD(P)-dependent alcohol dehydrogenase n=1 Tax=unclassified Streptomyces TaxID=2593676 RepID=UPI0022511231|nr:MULTISPECIES: NAD(P)-dependent alcohol dehydrogenase [unclassified Streptomyces]MCX5337278.1 NAD(P)-dependent alcohol dehydrogenase [Streptomyces sp. NBC_00140]MCX5365771.1 NAD(P)-dependent alcohol dehydrogenase [Streptomyces sp. NBC_00124]
MKAVQYRRVGHAPEVVEVPVPEPGPGQVLLKVTAAGLCHSDLAVMGWPEEQFPYPLPMTLGHEGVGTVAAVGSGVTAVAEGDDVAVYGPWGCGRCHNCAQGKENCCPRAAGLGILPPGLGSPGALAEYMLVDSPRHLVPLNGLDPVQAAPLTDAGLTPYHAIRKSLPKLVPGSTAVVIGVGGLGHLAVQLLRALTPARVVALDVSKEKLELARTVGAHEPLLSDGAAAPRVRELTGGTGADVVLDFVGAEATLAVAAASVAVEGDVTIVGIGGGTLAVGFGGGLPFEVSASFPYWGSRPELMEVVELARQGLVSSHVETFTLDEAPTAYERLHAGDINGRAVVLPHG